MITEKTKKTNGTNNFTLQQIENNEAKQRLNNEYLKLNGSYNTESTVGFFTKHNKIFQILAVLFSAIGVYFDLLSLVGLIGSLLIGLAVGLFLEFGKDRLTKGLFNTSLDDISRYGLVGGSLFVIMLIALLLHIRSINNFAGINFQKQTNTIYQDELKLSSANTAINLELAKALNNGTSHDDIISAKAIESNNQSLKNMSNSNAKDALLFSFQENKNTLKSILYLLFISVEFFSLFGVFGMLIIQRNTDKNIKSVVTTADKLANMEANVYQAVETNMINTSLAKIENMQTNVNHSPTPSSEEQQNSYNQIKNAQIPLNLNGLYKMPTNPYLMGVTNRLSENQEKTDFTPIINKRNPTKSGTRTVLDDHLKENLNKTEKKEEKTEKTEGKKVVDLMKFSHKESEFIKLLWDNGTVQNGDKLIPKRFILEQSVKGRETERELVNLYAKLEDMNLIMFKNGYRALANMENIVKTK